VEPEGAGANRRGRGRGDERVARARADPLADAVDHPDREHVPGRGGEGDERPDDGRDRVADEDERLEPSAPIGEETGRVLEDVRDEVGGALDEPDEGVRRPEAGEEGGEEREDRLARGVGEEAHEPQADDGRGQLLLRPTPRVLAVLVHRLAPPIGLARVSRDAPAGDRSWTERRGALDIPPSRI
jgi:hypothetical protein